METARKFLTEQQFDSPAADISFEWQSTADASLKLRLHLSRVVGGPPNDLELSFDCPLAAQWEEESFGLIGSPTPLPKCQNPQFLAWVHPALVIDNSKWADTYAARLFSEDEFMGHDIKHYFFVSMNDLVHVLSQHPPVARWVAPVDA